MDEGHYIAYLPSPFFVQFGANDLIWQEVVAWRDFFHSSLLCLLGQLGGLIRIGLTILVKRLLLHPIDKLCCDCY